MAKSRPATPASPRLEKWKLPHLSRWQSQDQRPLPPDWRLPPAAASCQSALPSHGECRKSELMKSFTSSARPLTFTIVYIVINTIKKCIYCLWIWLDSPTLQPGLRCPRCSDNSQVSSEIYLKPNKSTNNAFQCLMIPSTPPTRDPIIEMLYAP